MYVCVIQQIRLFLAKYKQSARISVIVQLNGIEHSSVDTAHGIW